MRNLSSRGAGEDQRRQCMMLMRRDYGEVASVVTGPDNSNNTWPSLGGRLWLQYRIKNWMYRPVESGE